MDYTPQAISFNVQISGEIYIRVVGNSNSMPWGKGVPQDIGITLPWIMATEQDVNNEISWSMAIPQDIDNNLPWAKATPQDISVSLPWAMATPQDVSVSLPWAKATPQDVSISLPWAKATPQDVDNNLPWGMSTPQDVSIFTDFTRGTDDTPQEPLIDFGVLPWRASQGVIVVNHTITLTVGGSSVKIITANVSMDWNSFCWSVQCQTADRTNANICRPNTSGTIRAKTGILTVNEYSWDFYIENMEESYDFEDNGTYTISGRSPTVRIAKPYAAGENRTYDTNTTYYAAVSDELTDSGSGIAYDLTDIAASFYGLDYAIPADLYGIQDKAWMDVLSELTNTFGGFIQTSRYDIAVANGNPSGELQFKRRYPEWTSLGWSGEVPDEFLSTGTVLSQDLSYEAKPGYDLAVCTATEYVNGEISIVTRDGTAGTTGAPPVSEILLNNNDEQTERARTILDTDGYDQTIYTMTFPLPTKTAVAGGVRPKLLMPRDLIEMDDLFDTGWRGVVTSVAIVVELTQVTQSVTVERKHI